MRILVSAESFGYGPVTTGLNVVKELRKYPDVTLDFIGSGIALEQAKLSGYFLNFYVCDTYDLDSLRKYKDILSSYDAYLSAENLNGAIFALENGLYNTYYLDNLMWMWDKIPTELNNVKKYFISEIIPCHQNFARIGKAIKNPVFVGPIRQVETKKCPSQNQLMINIGGAESFLLDHHLIVNFYDKLINDILEVPELERFSTIILCGGSRVIKGIKLKGGNPKVKKCTLSHDEYLKEMEKSSYCIMASGLGNFIEAVGKNKNIMFLPPINYSQLQQLEYYEENKFGFDIINWSDFDFYEDIPKYLDEETGVALVTLNIEKYMQQDYKALIQNLVRKFVDSDQESFYNVRNKYVERFDKDASSKIAKIIYEENC